MRRQRKGGMLGVMNADEQDTGVLFIPKSFNPFPSSTQRSFSKDFQNLKSDGSPPPTVLLGSESADALNPLFEDKPI